MKKPAAKKDAVPAKKTAKVAVAKKVAKAPAAKKASKAAKPARAAKAVTRATEVADDEDAEESAAPVARGKGKQLVIVESPAKAKTINKYLGPGFVVQASVGHIRDLPTKSPKGEKQAVPGVDIEHGFKPTYEVLASKSKTVADLKKAAKGASDVWFATDLDREGEAIAWHLAEVLGIKPQNAKRVVFNAITQQAVHKAFAQPAADQRRQGQRPAGAPYPRPHRRLPGVAAAVEEGLARAVGRARAVGGGASGRRT